MAEKAKPPSLAEYQANYRATELPLTNADALITSLDGLKQGKIIEVKAMISASEYNELMSFVAGRRANGVRYEVLISDAGIVLKCLIKPEDMTGVSG